MSVNYRAISIAFTIIKCLAVILTLFRLGFRLKIQRFWWEDTWAAVASLCTLVSIISVLAVSGTDSYEPILIAGRVNAYMFTCIIWSVRMSLIFSTIRIISSTSLRRITLAIAVSCFLFWAITLSLQVWWCLTNAQMLPGKPGPDCVLSRSLIIFEVTTNCIADMATVIFPVKLLWRVKLPRRQRRMILSLFSTSRFLCMFSLAHSISQLVGSLDVQAILANLQLGAFMIICNLLVVVTYVYRVFLNSSDEELSDPSGDDDFTTPAPQSRSSQDLTTVDLESPHISITETSSELKSTFFPSPAHSTRDSGSER